MEQRETSAAQLVESQSLPIKGAVSSDTLQVCSQGESDRLWWGSCTKTTVLVSQNDLDVGSNLFTVWRRCWTASW